MAPARTHTPQASVQPPFKGVVLTQTRKDYVEPLQQDMVPMPFASAKIGALKEGTSTAMIANTLKHICSRADGNLVMDSLSFDLVRGCMDTLCVSGLDG